jgi:hypothetical protein
MRQLGFVCLLAASFVFLSGCDHLDALKNSVQLKELGKADAAELAETPFDPGAKLIVRGRVTTLFFSEPGSTGMMIVHTDDGSQSYAFSTSSTKELARQGFSRFSIGPGEEIVVTGVTARDGKKLRGFTAARADTILKADGKKLYERPID